VESSQGLSLRSNRETINLPQMLHIKISEQKLDQQGRLKRKFTMERETKHCINNNIKFP